MKNVIKIFLFSSWADEVFNVDFAAIMKYCYVAKTFRPLITKLFDEACKCRGQKLLLNATEPHIMEEL